MSLTLDASLFQAPLSIRKKSKDGEFILDNEIHIRYKQNAVKAQKDFSDYGPYTNRRKDYYSNWYNAALLYQLHLFIVPPPGENTIFDFTFWIGVSTEKFDYRTGIDYIHESGVPGRAEFFLESTDRSTGYNLGLN